MHRPAWRTAGAAGSTSASVIDFCAGKARIKLIMLNGPLVPAPRPWPSVQVGAAVDDDGPAGDEVRQWVLPTDRLPPYGTENDPLSRETCPAAPGTPAMAGDRNAGYVPPSCPSYRDRLLTCAPIAHVGRPELPHLQAGE